MISIVAAVSFGGVIGADNKIPWHLSSDLKYFKKLTSGHPVIMGRKTFESIGRPLPDRTNIIISKSGEKAIKALAACKDCEGLAFCEITFSFDEALRVARRSPGSEKIFIIGGGEIYNIAFGHPEVRRIYLTLVRGKFKGDAFFDPDFSSGWQIVSIEHFERGKKDSHSYTRFIMDKR